MYLELYRHCLKKTHKKTGGAVGCGMNLCGDCGDSGIYVCLSIERYVTPCSHRAVNIDLIFQNHNSSYIVESFPLEMPITLQDTRRKDGWQMYLLLILPM